MIKELSIKELEDSLKTLHELVVEVHHEENKLLEKDDH